MKSRETLLWNLLEKISKNSYFLFFFKGSLSKLRFFQLGNSGVTAELDHISRLQKKRKREYYVRWYWARQIRLEVWNFKALGLTRFNFSRIKIFKSLYFIEKVFWFKSHCNEKSWALTPFWKFFNSNISDIFDLLVSRSRLRFHFEKIRGTVGLKKSLVKVIKREFNGTKKLYVFQ